MKHSLEEALKNTDTTYNELVEIANNMFSKYTKELNLLIVDITNNIESMTNDRIRSALLKLSLQGFQFGDVKEKSSLKAVCAEALRKEAYAREFNLGDGSVAAKDNNATLKISNEVMVEAIYDVVASLFKTKLDEIHRLTDSLKTVLTTRLQEAKLNSTVTVE